MSKIIIRLVFYTDYVVPLLSSGYPDFLHQEYLFIFRHTARITPINNSY
ncbi:Uncharacterised protein [Yersinia kristensenii]|nr:Uncharacterised protein [Yersinia kristensenii]